LRSAHGVGVVDENRHTAGAGGFAAFFMELAHSRWGRCTLLVLEPRTRTLAAIAAPQARGGPRTHPFVELSPRPLGYKSDDKSRVHRGTRFARHSRVVCVLAHDLVRRVDCLSSAVRVFALHADVLNGGLFGTT